MFEERGQGWAFRMGELLRGAKEAVDRAKAAGLSWLDSGALDLIEGGYDKIVADGLADNPPKQVIKRGDSVRFLPFAELLH